MMRAYIALGSNLPSAWGPPGVTVRHAAALLDGLAGCRVVGMSSLHETDPVGPGDQPRYVNAALVLETEYRPRELLDAMLRVELEMGREREEGARWQPRVIDLDLLMMEDRVIDEPGLTLPHPRMHERGFVLGPLAEVAAGVVIPGVGMTVVEALERLREGAR